MNKKSGRKHPRTNYAQKKIYILRFSVIDIVQATSRNQIMFGVYCLKQSATSTCLMALSYKGYMTVASPSNFISTPVEITLKCLTPAETLIN